MTLFALMGAATQAVMLGQTKSGATRSETAQIQAADVAFRAGYAAFQQNDLRTAHAEFAKAVRLAPKIAAAHSAYGAVLLAEGDAGGAEQELEAAKRLGATDAPTKMNLAMAYSQVREYGKAVAEFKALSAGEALRPEAIVAYATALNATGEKAAAQAELEAGVRSFPESAALHDALGTVLAQAERYDEAGAEFQRAIAADGSLAAAHFHLGSVRLAEHDAGAAMDELKLACSLAKENVVYSIQLGRALTAAGRDSDAVETLRGAVSMAPDSIDAKYELAFALQAAGSAKEAIPLFEEVVRARPQDATALTNLGLAMVQTGDAKGAVPIYERALKVNANSATLREDMGVAYLQQSDLDHAIEQFRAGLELERDNPQLHYDLGLAYKLKDNLAMATPEFLRAEELDVNLPDPPYTLGILYMQQGRFAEAQAQLEKATGLNARNGVAWEALGNVYKQSEQQDKAVAALRQAIALLPDQPSPHISVAAILAQKGDAKGAAAERKIAADLSRVAVSRQRANFALDSGRLLLKRGQVAEAIDQLEAAVAADPNYVDPHLALADALARGGRSAEAAVERQKAAKLAGGAVAP